MYCKYKLNPNTNLDKYTNTNTNVLQIQTQSEHKYIANKIQVLLGSRECNRHFQKYTSQTI